MRCLLGLLFFLILSSSLRANDGGEGFYHLEALEVVGSSRLDPDVAMQILDLSTGELIDTDLVMNARDRLLGLGLFRTMLLRMERGSRKGWAKIVVEVEDDSRVVSPWALGFTGGAGYGSHDNFGEQETGVGARVGIVGRNIFRLLHRAKAGVEVDSEGKIAQLELAYGVPRNSADGAQFDSRLLNINARTRYLDALGFATRIEGVWSRSFDEFGQVTYGLAYLSNDDRTQAASGFARRVFGPRLAYRNETRLRMFLPGEGHSIEAGVLIGANAPQNSVLEFHLAHTWRAQPALLATLKSDVLSSGDRAFAARGEVRADITELPFVQLSEEKAVFARVRGGLDSIGADHLWGAAGSVGLRFIRSGIIGELYVIVAKTARGSVELR